MNKKRRNTDIEIERGDDDKTRRYIDVEKEHRRLVKIRRKIISPFFDGSLGSLTDFYKSSLPPSNFFGY